jgi:hypothetical protein
MTCRSSDSIPGRLTTGTQYAQNYRSPGAENTPTQDRGLPALLSELISIEPARLPKFDSALV